ncbi:hypothetical protein CIB84_015787 [Bambusicola thoracicus]|uniref:Uncharacterized protein n=1 Tax=Bambusicola thoracicus TaxID=9083 RepID=A0A2P4S8M9_BAMTH|nr:hypothetical protein CIB84_015787 [Bambusicola thoracicus]
MGKSRVPGAGSPEHQHFYGRLQPKRGAAGALPAACGAVRPWRCSGPRGEAIRFSVPPSTPSPPRGTPVRTRGSHTARPGRSGAVPVQSSASRQSAPPLRPCFYVRFPAAAPLYVVIFRPIYLPAGQKHGPGRIQLVC